MFLTISAVAGCDARRTVKGRAGLIITAATVFAGTVIRIVFAVVFAGTVIRAVFAVVVVSMLVTLIAVFMVAITVVVASMLVTVVSIFMAAVTFVVITRKRRRHHQATHALLGREACNHKQPEKGHQKHIPHKIPPRIKGCTVSINLPRSNKIAMGCALAAQ
ncbi:hypothetical protein [Mariprofundus ferrooxydans]|uniref:hypothetical protein n=1 Tax=Mariprofundus ferrooxydans TaxID=314344 RepID=UPI00197E6243|nr:hypothetical protein [Mariprofundus ferrooxydans]